MNEHLITIMLIGIYIIQAIGFALIMYYTKTKTENVISTLSKEREKYLISWKAQKDLVFEFIEIYEKGFLSHPDWKSDENVRSKFYSDLNCWYGKAYTVFDAEILKKINEILNKNISDVQRYYMYKKIREQLLGDLFKEQKGYSDCPYIDSDNLKGMSFDEFQKLYPFIEVVDKPNTYKTLPYFRENK